MPAVVEVKISGESGFVLPEDEYADELTLTDHHIAYKCRRYEPLDLDPVQSWAYTTNSAAFKNLFSLAVRAVFESFERAIPEGDDMPVTRFRLTFQNEETIERVYTADSDEFSSCFSIIKKMIPPCEQVPLVLYTSEDYQKSKAQHETSTNEGRKGGLSGWLHRNIHC